MPMSGRTVRTTGAVAAFLLGAILLVAAWAKVLDPLAFGEQIHREGLDVLLSSGAMAILAIGLEIGLGLALLLGIRRPWVLWPTGALVLLFLLLTGRAYWLWSQGLLDDTAACGCFGNLVDRTPAEAFWQDLAMLLPLYLLSFLGRPRRGAPRIASWKLFLVMLGTSGGMLFAWWAPSLPLDDLATRLSPGVRVESICAGGEAAAERICLDVLLPALADGRHWVVLTELANETFVAGVEPLNALAMEDPEVTVWVLSADPLEAHQEFFWRSGPVFEVREVPLALIRPLYRTTPRSFRLENGMVSATVSGLPPDANPPNSKTTMPARGR